MGDRFREGLNAAAMATGRLIEERSRDLARARAEAERIGRRYWEAGTRLGENVVGRTREELIGLGEEYAAQQGYRIVRPRGVERGARGLGARGKPPVPRVVQAAPDYRRAAGLRDILRQERAFERAAFDAIALGGGDEVTAAASALAQPGGMEHWRQRYDAAIAEEHARTRYEWEQRPIVRGAGELTGTAASLAVPVGGFVRGGKLLRGAAGLTRRELAALAGVGAGAGATVQIATDRATGRSTSPGDAAGAALGGIAGVVAFPLSGNNPSRAAAADAWVASLSQDILNGRRPSLDRAATAAGSARLAGLGGAAVARTWSGAVRPAAAQRYGEIMGELRARLETLRLDPSKTGRDPLNYRYWIPDGWWGNRRFEYKGGYGSELSNAQQRAQEELDRNFTYYHTTPDDFGQLAGVPMGWFVRPPTRNNSSDLSRR